MIAVDVVHITEVQQFITYADPYETVGGFWSLSYPGKDDPRGETRNSWTLHPGNARTYVSGMKSI